MQKHLDKQSVSELIWP